MSESRTRLMNRTNDVAGELNKSRKVYEQLQANGTLVLRHCPILTDEEGRCTMQVGHSGHHRGEFGNFWHNSRPGAYGDNAA